MERGNPAGGSPVDVITPGGDYPAVLLEELQTAEIVVRAEVVPPDDSAAHSVARNTLILLVSQIITFSLTLVWTVVLLHMLGKDNYGKLSTALSLAWIGAVFMDAGISTYLTKQVARDRAHTAVLLSSACALRVATTILFYGAILGAAVLLGYDVDTVQATALVGASIVVAAFTQATAATFQGHEDMLWPALGTIAEKTTTTVLSVILLLLGYGLQAVATVLLLGALANFTLVGLRAWRRGWIRFRLDPVLVRKLIVGGAPFFLWASFGVIYQRNAVLQLEALTNSGVTGQFSAAARMYETLSFVPSIFQIAVMPVLARSFVHSTGAMHAHARRSVDLILLAALPSSVGVALFAPQIIALIADNTAFAGSVLPLRILGVSLLPLYVDMILATILISVDRQRQWSSIAIIAAILNPLLNWWLIPETQRQWGNGAIGAAFVTLATEVMIFFFCIFLVPRGILARSNLVIAGKTVLATAAMGLVLWAALPVLNGLAPGGGTSKLGAALVLALGAALGGAVFGGLAWLLGAVGPDELRLLRRALQRPAA